jgi:hypothetical protein
MAKVPFYVRFVLFLCLLFIYNSIVSFINDVTVEQCFLTGVPRSPSKCAAKFLCSLLLLYLE